MPGMRTSIPYFAEPSTLEGTSTRGMSLRPISRNWAGFFRSASVICGGSAGTVANLTTSPYEMRRPDFACTTTLGSVLNSSTGTLHCRATLSSSTRRACAPPMRIDIQ